MAYLKHVICLSGFNGVEANAILVTAVDNLGREHNILIDSGISMKSRIERDRLYRWSEGHPDPGCEIDAFLVTHAHADHAGYLPVMVAQNPKARVIMTRPTFYISGIMWENTLNLMINGRIYVPLKYKSNFANGAKIVITEKKDDIVEKPKCIELFPGISAYFHPNGHIRGSAMIFLKIGDLIILFSGDMSVYDSQTVKGLKIPEQFIGRVDMAFFESTYGDRVLVPREEAVERGCRLVKEVLSNDGSIVSPAFGIDRTTALAIDQTLHDIDPPYIDGMGGTITNLYSKSEGYWCENDHTGGVDLGIFDNRCVSGFYNRREIIYSGQPFNVITTAGMMTEGTPAIQYTLDNGFLENPKNLLGLAGYQAENSEGREIEDSIREGRPANICGRKITVRAKVFKWNISSHAGGDQLADVIAKLAPRKLFINHGTKSGRRGLVRELVLRNFNGQVYTPKNADKIE